MPGTRREKRAPEFAVAGFLRSFDENQPRDLTRDVLGGPVETAMWSDEPVAAPFWANTLPAQDPRRS